MSNEANTTAEATPELTPLVALLASLVIPEFDSVAAAARYGQHPVVNKWFEWGETNDPSRTALAISGAQEIALQDIIDAAIAETRSACDAELSKLREALRSVGAIRWTEKGDAKILCWCASFSCTNTPECAAARTAMKEEK